MNLYANGIIMSYKPDLRFTLVEFTTFTNIFKVLIHQSFFTIFKGQNNPKMKTGIVVAIDILVIVIC